MKEPSCIKTSFQEAVLYTLPIFAGFWFVGASYGLYMHSMGFDFWYPMVMAMIIFGGSLEFITVAMLVSPFAPVQTAVVALIVQARHFFYGLSMAEKYKGTGWKKPFLIFWLCDETFAMNYTASIPPGAERSWFYFFVSLQNYLYWVTGSLFGGLMGQALADFPLDGLEFVMTAMFIVIFLEQFLREKTPWPAAAGFGASLLCLCLFGAEDFMLPALCLIAAVLFAFRRSIEKAGCAE